MIGVMVKLGAAVGVMVDIGWAARVEKNMVCSTMFIQVGDGLPKSFRGTVWRRAVRVEVGLVLLTYTYTRTFGEVV